MSLILSILLLFIGNYSDNEVTIAVVDTSYKRETTCEDCYIPPASSLNLVKNNEHGQSMIEIIQFVCGDCEIDYYDYYNLPFVYKGTGQQIALFKACVSDNKIVNYSIAGDYKDSITEWIMKLCYQSGKIVVAAAGNESDNEVNYPCGYNQYVLCAGALKPHSLFVSNPKTTNNSSIDYYAPSRYWNGLYYIEGTSISTARVSGFLYRIWSEYPEWSNQELLLNINRFKLCENNICVINLLGEYE